MPAHTRLEILLHDFVYTIDDISKSWLQWATLEFMQHSIATLYCYENVKIIFRCYLALYLMK